MTERDRIARKLAELEQFAVKLHAIPITDEKHYHSLDYITKAAVERHLQLISDTELDVLALVNKHLGLGVPGDDNSILTRLEGKFRKDTIAALRERRRLRNALIHAYPIGEYDRDVYVQATDLTDITKFATEVGKLLED